MATGDVAAKHMTIISSIRTSLCPIVMTGLRLMISDMILRASIVSCTTSPLVPTHLHIIRLTAIHRRASCQARWVHKIPRHDLFLNPIRKVSSIHINITCPHLVILMAQDTSLCAIRSMRTTLRVKSLKMRIQWRPNLSFLHWKGFRTWKSSINWWRGTSFSFCSFSTISGSTMSTCVSAYRTLKNSYVNDLSVKKQDKALIHAKRARNIRTVLVDPKDTAVESAQFRCETFLTSTFSVGGMEAGGSGEKGGLINSLLDGLRMCWIDIIRFWVKKMFKLQPADSRTPDVCIKLISTRNAALLIGLSLRSWFATKANRWQFAKSFLKS
jgi:hypothetical protein